MDQRLARLFAIAALALGAAGWAGAQGKLETPRAKSSPSQPDITFERDIKPIFQAHCTECHGPQTAKAKLRLDTRTAALKEQRIIRPGRSNESKLITAIARVSSKPAENMPPEGKGAPLTLEQVGLIRLWVDQGAK